MSSPIRQVLFLGHEASRTGAPLLLLYLARWLKQHHEVELRFIFGSGGPLIEEFKQLGPTVQISDFRLRRWRAVRKALKVFSPAGRTLGDKLYRAALNRVAPSADLIYANTVASADLVKDLLPLRAPLICHFHELEFAITVGGGVKRADVIREAGSRFIACADAVRANMVDRHQFPADRVDVVHEFIPTSVRTLEEIERERATAKQKLCNELGLPAGTNFVAMCGQQSWRKGTDLFIQVARSVALRHPAAPIHFVWIGGQESSWPQEQSEHDVRQLGLGGRCHFVGIRVDPMPYLAASDLFVLTSREDPFPLVCIEAAAMGSPIISFENSGGIPELIESDCGVTVSYLDVDAMADQCVELIGQPERRRKMGEAAARKVRERYDVGVAIPKIERIMESVSGKHLAAPKPASE